MIDKLKKKQETRSDIRYQQSSDEKTENVLSSVKCPYCESFHENMPI